MLSQADIDALLGRATPTGPLEPPGPSEEAQALEGLTGQVAALSGRVANVEGQVTALDSLLTRLERVEQAIISVRQARNADMRRLQTQVSSYLAAIMEQVRAMRSPATAPGGAQPAARPAAQAAQRTQVRPAQRPAARAAARGKGAPTRR